MKKLLVSVLSISLLLTGCAKEKENMNLVVNEEEAWQEISESAGETLNGEAVVTLTLPGAFVNAGILDEDLFNTSSKDTISFEKNSDGSVTIKLNKTQYLKMMKELSEGLDQALKTITESNIYPIKEITHDASFATYDITLKSNEVSLTDKMVSQMLSMYSNVFGTFYGKKDQKTTINYYNSDGKFIETQDVNGLFDFSAFSGFLGLN